MKNELIRVSALAYGGDGVGRGADGKVTPVQESNGTMKLDIASTPVVVLMESENRYRVYRGLF